MSNRTADTQIAVRLHGVSKSFGTVKALKETSIEVRQGELMTLLGPSGCGKTTLLNIVAGFLSADEGSLEIAGARMNNMPAFQREIGMMFQNYALFPHMTVEANVGYGLKMRRLPKAEIAKRVSEALALVKLTTFEDRKPRQLSGGQQQRVALARALVIRPKVLLLDEPFSALDKNLRASMQVEVKDIQRKLGLTAIFVTHDQSEALSLSDRLAVMSEGRICQVGTPEEIYANPADRFVASFIGDVNVVLAHIESLDDEHAQITLGEARIRVPRQHLGGAQSGDAVDLFVRPQQLRFVEAGEGPALRGFVHAKIYQGGHTDVLVDIPGLLQEPVRVRLSGQVAPGGWPAGMAAGIAFSSETAIAFPREKHNQ
jgi:putative spermidine/putrescine transport system ATP-binding protein/spermidine/putrescine transport system ATP-binding protein